jgi:Flp pilus assembly protein TadB
MELLGAMPVAITFTHVVCGAAALLMLLAFGLFVGRPSATSKDPNSMTNLCVKYLDQGHDVVATLEFVADRGPSARKREFQGYVKRLRQGRSLEEILDSLRKSHPTSDTEMLIACLASKAQTEQFSAVSSEIVRHAVQQREQSQADLNFIVGSSRRWVIGLVWIGVLGGAMLLIALPAYSDALLNTPAGRPILVIALCLEAVGLIVSGRLLNLARRLDRNLNEP